jgi:hypothetical protein
MILAGHMLLVKSETENLKSLLDSYHTDVQEHVPIELSKVFKFSLKEVAKYLQL